MLIALLRKLITWFRRHPPADPHACVHRFAAVQQDAHRPLLWSRRLQRASELSVDADPIAERWIEPCCWNAYRVSRALGQLGEPRGMIEDSKSAS